MKFPNSISEMVEERISKLEDKLGLSNLRKRIKKNKQNLAEPEGKKRTNGAERITEEIMVKIFPNLILKY